MLDALLAGVAAAGDGGLEAVAVLGLESQQGILTGALLRPIFGFSQALQSNISLRANQWNPF